jgi:assimilatory nitrate reductase catalytic subunit
MSNPPSNLLPILDRFGPHLNRSSPVRLATDAEPDRLVKTHCCFCGQQCRQLRSKTTSSPASAVVRLPLQPGMLCPKGVKHTFKGAHPDRLLTASSTSVPEGFSPMGYQEAIARVAAEIGRIQKTYGNSAMGVLSGASLTVEKAYLMGKFARVCLKTPYIDYNGRLCMVSAGAGNKKAFGIDRAANPWSDIPTAELIWISGPSPSALITTEYVWRARSISRGSSSSIPDHTAGHTCDLFLPVKRGVTSPCSTACFT